MIHLRSVQRGLVRPGALVLLSALALGLLPSPGRRGTTHAGEAAARTAGSRPTTPPAVLRLYTKMCAKCHGAGGKGEDMRDIMPEIPDFTSGKWQKGRTDPQVLASILDGKGKRMPAFAGKVSRDQARKLVAHVRSFGPAQARSRPSRSSMTHFEREFLNLQEQFDRLHRELRILERRRPGKQASRD